MNVRSQPKRRRVSNRDLMRCVGEVSVVKGDFLIVRNYSAMNYLV